MIGSKSRMQGKTLPERSADAPVYVGIDVCKAWLDIYLHPVAIRLRVENSGEGVRQLKRALAGRRIGLVVMEATAKYHRRAHRMLDAAGYFVAVVNPLRARLFAEALGVLAKTDRIDARLLAIMGESLKLKPTPLPAEALQELQELVNARQAASTERAALANRLGASQVAFLRAELRRCCDNLDRHIARLEAEIERRLET
jgi:transposase